MPTKIEKVIKTTINEDLVTKSPKNNKRMNQSNAVYYC